MIDGIKAIILDSKRFEQSILANNLVPLSGGRTDYFTGNILEYPKNGRLNSLDYKITLKEATLCGSLHKFYNNVINGRDGNYDDFPLSSVKRGIALVKHILDVDFDTPLTNIEFGFNLPINYDPNDFVKYRLLLYDFQDHDERSNFDTGEFYKEYSRTDYKWKIYKKRNKEKPSENILRFEMKILRSRQLNKLGIHTIGDLIKIQNLHNLFKFILEKYDKLMIVDNINNANITSQEYIQIMKMTNITYWNGLIEAKSTNRILQNRKASAIELIQKLKLDSTKEMLRGQVMTKFSLLLNS